MGIIYIAAFMACITGTEPTYDSCVVVQGKVKFENEEDCMMSLAERLNMMMETGLMKDYKFTEVKCISWGDKEL